MKLGKAVNFENRFLNDTDLGKVLVELPRAISARLDPAKRPALSFSYKVDKDASVPGAYIYIHTKIPGTRVHKGNTYGELTQITAWIIDELMCSSYERKQQGLPPDVQQFTADVWTDAQIRHYRCRRWEKMEPRNPYHYDTDISVIVAEIADNVVDMLYHRNHK